MPKHHKHPNNRTVERLPLALHSQRREFGNHRVCAFACVALSDDFDNVVGWHVFLENWVPGAYDETRTELAVQKYLGDEWLDAIRDYLTRCRHSALDAGFTFSDPSR
jgi:hypothetical protein